MTPNLIVGVLLGHLVGDYVFQNNWMALAKNRNTFRCVVHCLIYTLAVCVLTSWHPAWVAVVFLSHFPVDRWTLADKWLRLIRGRSIKTFMENGHEDIPLNEGPVRENYRIVRGGFTSLVYAGADNTFHLLIMFGGWMLLSRWFAL